MRTLALVLLCTPSVLSQRLPTTLDDFVRRADAVVVARTLLVGDAEQSGRRAVFAVHTRLRGESERIIEIRDGGAGVCGSALTPVMPGIGVLLFLRIANGRTTLVDDDARALAVLEPGLTTHVQALISARDPAARNALLADALRGPSARVRNDAARALSIAPSMSGLDGRSAASIADALRDGLAQPDGTTLALLQLAERLDDGAIDAVVLDHLCDAPPSRLAALATRCLATRDAEVLAGAIRARVHARPQRAAAALRLARALPARATTAIHAALAADPDGLVRRLATRSALLQRTDPGAPTFRAIVPRSR